jgi:hypothetical protein
MAILCILPVLLAVYFFNFELILRTSMFIFFFVVCFTIFYAAIQKINSENDHEKLINESVNTPNVSNFLVMVEPNNSEDRPQAKFRMVTAK